MGRGLWVNQLAAHESLQDSDIFQLFRRNAQNIAVHDDKIRQLAALEGTFLVFLETDVGGIPRVHFESLQNSDAFFRSQHLAGVKLAAIHSRPDAPPWTDGSNGNIGGPGGYDAV